MNKMLYSSAAVLVILLIILGVRISSLSGLIDTRDADAKVRMTKLQDSVLVLQRQIDTLRQQVPGLGEYMSTMQLHISKIWFASKFRNWDLTAFELGELNEAVDAAQALHATRRGVDISAVLQSVQETQISLMGEATRRQQADPFMAAYDGALEACNACHRSAGYGFIRIVRPNGEPVTNQQWAPVK